MHQRLLRLLLPLCLLGSSACLDIPELETPGTQQPTDRFSLSIDAGQVTVFQGGSRSLQLSLSRAEGFTDSVTVQWVNPPAGISAPPVTISAGSTSATWTISANGSAEPGPKTLTLRGTAGRLIRDTPVTLTVARQGDIVVQWASPSQAKAYAKDSMQVQVWVEGGMAETIDLYKGTELLTRLAGPAYQYTWDTSQEAEGEYTLTARARVGGTTFNSAIRTIVVDHTAPTVVARTPAPGATSVSVRDSLQVRFDEALRATSVTDASVVLSTSGSPNIAKTLSLSADGKTLTISPSSPPSLPADVSVALGTPTAPLTDLAGNTLAPSSTWSFTVPAWLPLGGAISAVPENTAAENVAMKVGTDGNPVIAWSESDGSSKNIYVRRWTGTNWVDLGSALSAVSGVGTNAGNPALLLNAENHPIIIWDEQLGDGGTNNLFGKKWTGTSWEDLPAFSLNTDERRSGASIAFDNVGNIIVSAYEIQTASQQIATFRLAPASAAWESESSSLPSYPLPLFTKVTTDATGNWFITFNYLDSDGVKDYRPLSVLKKAPYSTWTPQGMPVISPAKKNCVAASLAVGGDNQPRIAWEEADAATSNIHAAFYDGSSWKIYGDTIHTSTTSNKTPSLVMGHDGNPVVAWSGYASPEQSIWVRRWTGSTWQQVGSRLNAVNGATTSGFQPALALDSNGQPIVAWQESDSSVSNIYVYRYNN